MIAAAFSCPRCSAPSGPSPAPQRCRACGKTFTLTAGPGHDASLVVPAPHPGTFPIHLKWSVVVTYRFARLDPGGLTSGTLDPVIGMTAVDQVAIGFPEVVSIAVWRDVGWVDCILGVLVPLPIALFAMWVVIAGTMHSGVGGLVIAFAVIALLFGLLAGYMIRRGVVIGKRRARVVGRHGAVTVPFSTSPVFHAELFRRAGLAAPPIP